MGVLAIDKKKRDEIIAAIKSGSSEEAVLKQYEKQGLTTQALGAWKRFGYLDTPLHRASQAKAMPAEAPKNGKVHKKSTWTLTLTNGTKQFAATINSSAIKRILGVVIGDA